MLKSDHVSAPQVSVQTAAGPMAFAQGEQIAVRSPTNGQQQFALTNVPIVFAGYGVTAPERQWDDFKDVDVRGKIIVVLVNDPDFEGGEGNFGGKAMTYYGRWTYKYEEGARRGAAGVHGRSRNRPRLLRLGDGQELQHDHHVRHRPPEPGVRAHAVRKLDPARHGGAAVQGAPGSTSKRRSRPAKRKDFRPIDLKATLNANVNAKTEVITSYNVVGILPGKKHPDETVIYTAHHDHLGIGLPDANGDRIYNGALDNSTGTAHLIEQARAFAKKPRTDRSSSSSPLRPRKRGCWVRSIYASNPLYPLGKTVGILNTDGGAIYGPARDFSISGTAKLDLLDMLIAEGKRQGRNFTPDPRVEAGSFYRSDHFPFAKAGVPAISWRPGIDLLRRRYQARQGAAGRIYGQALPPAGRRI